MAPAVRRTLLHTAASQVLRLRAQAKMLVAEVLSVEPHPSADRLRVVTVDTGSRTVKVGSRASRLRSSGAVPRLHGDRVEPLAALSPSAPWPAGGDQRGQPAGGDEGHRRGAPVPEVFACCQGTGPVVHALLFRLCQRVLSRLGREAGVGLRDARQRHLSQHRQRARSDEPRHAVLCLRHWVDGCG